MLLASTASSFALASACLLPQPAGAVPIQTPNSPLITASAPDPGSAGPRRPGAIPATSLRLNGGSSVDRNAGPRRPVPGQQGSALTAEK
jgi:hypothetical protein